MPAALPRSAMRRGAEVAQQAHHVVIVFRWRRAAAEYPVKQIRVGAIEQRFELVELGAVQALETFISEHAENHVVLLRSAMPAPEQQPPAADIKAFVVRKK